MLNILKYIGIGGFFICLIIMYTTNHGIPGLRKYDNNFKFLDMQFRYNAAIVYDAFEKIGKDGRKVYRGYWILDFVFIACFLIVQITLLNGLSFNGLVRNILIVLSISRAVFDILENCMLIYLIDKFPSVNNLLANICSCVTTMKFTVLYLWLLGISIFLFFPLV